MIVSASNKDAQILDNIVGTLSQIKIGGIANQPLLISGVTTNDTTVSFYTNAAYSDLLFTEDSATYPGHFSTTGTTTSYVPPDEKINFGPALSPDYSLPLYYVTASLGTNSSNYTYNNKANLMFNNVIVSSKKKPAFSQNSNEAIIMPLPAKTEVHRVSDDVIFTFPSFEIYVNLLVFNWKNLSEQERMNSLSNVENIVRNALYVDPTRGGICTFVNSEIWSGTKVGRISPLPSPTRAQGCIIVDTAYWSSEGGLF